MVALTELEPLDSARQVDMGLLYKEPQRWGLQEEAIDSDLEVLKARGWVRFWPDLEGIGTVVVDQPGVDAATEFQSLRSNRVRRNRACRDAFLHWLYDANSPGQFHQTHFFMGTSYKEHEVKDAKNWLKGEGFITGPTTADDDIYYAQITSRGIRVVESGTPVDEWTREGSAMTNNNINIHGSQNVNVAQNSSHVKQSNTLTQEQLGKITDVIESYRALSGALNLPEEQRAAAEALVGEIEGEAADVNAEPGKIRQGLERLARIVTEHGAKGVATAVFSVIEQALQFLG